MIVEHPCHVLQAAAGMVSAFVVAAGVDLVTLDLTAVLQTMQKMLHASNVQLRNPNVLMLHSESVPTNAHTTVYVLMESACAKQGTLGLTVPLLKLGMILVKMDVDRLVERKHREVDVG
jgi:hypothetical protein